MKNHSSSRPKYPVYLCKINALSAPQANY